MIRRATTLAGALGLLLSGCGGGEFEIAPVSGTVTLNGEPLAGALVSFEPSTSAAHSGPGSAGETDPQGRFSLTTVDGRRGVVVGRHRVVISTLKYQENRSDSAILKKEDVLEPERVPLRYNAESGLTFDVPSGGTDRADFELTGPPPKPSSKGGPRR